MRTCNRCNTEMIEDLGISIEGSRYRVNLVDDERKILFRKTLGRIKAAVCPKCGEISLYVENVDLMNDTLKGLL